MNTRRTESASDRDDQLIATLMEEYLARLERGEQPDRQEYLDRFPEHAETLSTALAGLDLLDRVGTGLRVPPIPDLTMAPDRHSLLGDFRLVREVGRGGMGVVYDAQQQSLGRRVAIKVLPFAAILDEQQRIRFQNEARAAATLDHPHIVRIHAVGVDRGIHYFAMQFIEGQSLAQLLHDVKRRSGYCLTETTTRTKPPTSDASLHHTENNPRNNPRESNNANGPTATTDTTQQLQANLSTERLQDRTSYYRNIARLGVQIAEALQHAHERGIIHRDIKPANIMLDAHGRAVITDFGLARFDGEVQMTMTGNVVGTLRYAAPEQLLGDRAVVDERVDVYSLGVTLYELITLQPPFDGEGRERLLQQAAFGVAKAPRAIDSSIPIDLETIVLKAIEKQPDQRYSSAAALAEDLRRFLQQRPIIARRPSLLQHATKWLQRNPATAGSLAFALVTAMLCFALLSLHSYRGMQREAQLRQEAQDAARRAQAYSQVAQQTIDDFLSEFAQELEEQPDVGVVSERLYLRAMEMYKLLLAQSATNRPLRRKAADAYLKAAQQMWNRRQYSAATQLMELATDSYRALVHDEPAEPSHRIKLAAALSSLGRGAINQLDYASALKHLSAAMALLETPVGDNQDVERLATLASCHAVYGAMYAKIFDVPQANLHFAQSVECSEQVRRLRLSDDDLYCLSYALNRSGLTARNSNRVSRSEQYLIKDMEMLNQRVADPERYGFRVMLCLCDAKLQLAVLFTGTGRFDAARRELDEAINALQEIRSHHSEQMGQGFLEWCYVSMAELQYALGDLPAAEEYSRRSLASTSQAVKEIASEPFHLSEHGNDQYLLGDILYAVGATSEASALLAAAREDLESVQQIEIDGRRTCIPELMRFLALCPDERYADPRRAAALAQNWSPSQSGPLVQLRAIAQLQAGHYSEAIASCESAMALRSGGDAVDWLIMALAHAESGDLQQARTWYDKQADAPSPQSPIDTLNCTLPQFDRLRRRAAALLE